MIIDSHCHLDYEPLVNNINEVLLNAKKNNITNLLTIGTSLESSKKVLEIVEKYENIYTISTRRAKKKINYFLLKNILNLLFLKMFLLSFIQEILMRIQFQLLKNIIKKQGF